MKHHLIHFRHFHPNLAKILHSLGVAEVENARRSHDRAMFQAVGFEVPADTNTRDDFPSYTELRKNCTIETFGLFKRRREVLETCQREGYESPAIVEAVLRFYEPRGVDTYLRTCLNIACISLLVYKLVNHLPFEALRREKDDIPFRCTAWRI